MNEFVLSVGNDQYRIALPTQQAIDAEKQLGSSLFEAMDHAESVTVQTILLWAGLQKYKHGTTLAKTGVIMDAMGIHGCSFNEKDFDKFTIEARVALCMEILTVGGFFTEEKTQEIQQEMSTNLGEA